ncbi:hypothetical protein [Arthrobacter sp. KBS0703]|jgi:hypothetical protein|uniref:hypothetical protein n=2 Tax=Bacteria TaxID=2 RepID=UPI00163DC5F2|nr:hypothetical protein [Arthrobacter sp. KBS0703]
MNVASADSLYSTRGPAESAVLAAAPGGAVSPLVWWGAGLLVLAGAAGIAVVRIRRSL